MTVLDVVALTHRGRVRGSNEDTVAVAGFLGSAADGELVRLTIDSRRPVSCLVADGLGGHAQGGRASRLVALQLSDAWARAADPDSLTRAVHDANDLLYEEMQVDPLWAGMGSTLVGLVFAAGRVVCVNVGDSRCHRLVGDGRLVQVSVDDSPVRAAGAPEVSSVVTQTLGGGSERTVVEPHVWTSPTVPGDRFLVSSDGLTDYLPTEEIESVLAGADPVRAVGALVDATFARGAPDNVSVLLATVHA